MNTTINNNSRGNLYNLNKYEQNYRNNIIDIIQDLKNNDGWYLYYNNKVVDGVSYAAGVSEANMKKLYVSYGFMDIVIKKIVSFCPTLTKVNTSEDDKISLIKKALQENNWEIKNEGIYNDLESKGDVFFYMYYNVDENFPRLKKLKAKCMKDIITDDDDIPIAYIYEEKIETKTHTPTGDVSYKYRTVTWVFERGRTIINDPDLPEPNIIINKDSFIDDFAILHIKSFQGEETEFSNIPAEKYIDHILNIDQITSELRQTNRVLGFPQLIAKNCRLVAGERSPMGIMIFEDFDSPETEGQRVMDKTSSNSEVKDIQISNKLDSIFTEYENLVEMLFISASLVSLKSEQIIGRSDSGRVVKQFRLPLENKIDLYVTNIISAMQPFFKSLLKENDLYDESTDEYISFVKPEFIIENSPFDDLMYKHQLLNMGLKSIYELKKEEGLTDEEIKSSSEKIIEEAMRMKEITNETNGEASNQVNSENLVNEK